MKLGYVVLYVKDATACLDFWTASVGMVEKSRTQAGPFSIVRVGFADQDVALELVPLDLMKDNPHGLDLATPSIAFYVTDLEAVRTTFVTRGVEATEPTDRAGTSTFAFCDNEGRWFAVLQAA